MKKPERLRRSCSLSPVEALEARALLTMTATAVLPAVSATVGAAVAPVNLDSYFKDANAATDFAIFNTSLGTIPVLMTPKTTPVTVANFLNYVNKGDYTNTVVHRSVPGFIWQSGGYQLAASNNLGAITADAPIKNEFGASNVRGTIAMAKLGSSPNSATSQFFFNESDTNASNLDNQNSGFTVFGHVVGAAGLAVMDAVAAVPVPSPGPLSSPLDQIPLQNYTAGASVQPANLVLIQSVTPANELFLTSSDAPGVATATVQGSNLTITPLASGTANITVVGYGSDGLTATETFAVNVAASGTMTTSPTPTPTPTPTSTPTSTPTTPIATPPITTAPASLVTPTAKGALPRSVVAGQKTRIQQAVTLLDPAGTVAQTEHVRLSLSQDGLTPAYDIASATTTVKLKAGKLAKVNLAANHVSASVPAGTYAVVVTVTDPSGASTTAPTGKMMIVQAPRVKSTLK